MEAKIITYATPVFFLLIFAEIIASRFMKRAVYRVDDAISSISLGIMSQISGVFLRVITIGIYKFLHDRFSIVFLPADNVFVWMVALLGYDLCYYWLHRMGHEFSILWAAHVVHHQSEEYNLSTALRQTSTGVIFGWIFYVPLIIAGVPPTVFAVVALIDLLYQFWIHTQLIDRLGWYDRIFASPSNHRIHHAVNDRYLDKNYGGILIIWDRIFGTFVDEDPNEKIIYGTRSQLKSWNPVWANFEVYYGLIKDFFRTKSWSNRFAILSSKTGWRPADVMQEYPRPVFRLDRPGYDPRPALSLQIYGIVQFAMLLMAGMHFLRVQAGADPGVLALYAIWIILSLSCLGVVMESRIAGIRAELLRWTITGTYVASTGAWFMPGQLPQSLVILMCGWCLVSLVWVLVVGRRVGTVKRNSAP